MYFKPRIFDSPNSLFQEKLGVSIFPWASEECNDFHLALLYISIDLFEHLFWRITNRTFIWWLTFNCVSTNLTYIIIDIGIFAKICNGLFVEFCNLLISLLFCLFCKSEVFPVCL